MLQNSRHDNTRQAQILAFIPCPAVPRFSLLASRPDPQSNVLFVPIRSNDTDVSPSQTPLACSTANKEKKKKRKKAKAIQSVARLFRLGSATGADVMEKMLSSISNIYLEFHGPQRMEEKGRCFLGLVRGWVLFLGAAGPTRKLGLAQGYGALELLSHGRYGCHTSVVLVLERLPFPASFLSCRKREKKNCSLRLFFFFFLVGHLLRAGRRIAALSWLTCER
jgi:hypothetical protein